MKTNALPATWVFLAYFALTFYCLGAALMNEFVEYQSWADLRPYLSATDLASWHIATTQHTMPLLAIPLLLLTAVLVLLFWHLPPGVPRAALWLVAVCHGAFWGATLLMQWQLNDALLPTPLDGLLHSDWLRKLLLLLEAPLALFMAYQALRNARNPWLQSEARQSALY